MVIQKKVSVEIAAETKSAATQNYSVVLCDIEGTTTSIDFVYEVLFPYAKKRISALTSYEILENTELAKAIAILKKENLNPNSSHEDIVQLLIDWMNEDKKITILKEIQGIIWEEGYRKGDFKSHIYPDVTESFIKWQKNGKKIYIYSSGSVKAQNLLFANSNDGDLRSYLNGYFDTNIGSKREEKSYTEIASLIGIPCREILFLSDVEEELDAARTSGMQTALLARKGGNFVSKHCKITNFAELDRITVPKMRVFDDTGSIIASYDDNEKIAEILSIEANVLFEQWETQKDPITSQTSDQEISKIYEKSIEKLINQNNYKSFDIMHLRADNPNRQMFRQKFLEEHTHNEDEVRFFVSGKGLFYLHVKNKVLAVLCEQGDLISIPSLTKHWFDMSAWPNFTCLRFFNTQEGWVPKYTESKVEKKYPLYE